MTFKAILEGTLRRDAEDWIRQRMTASGYHIRNIEAESVTFSGRNTQATVHVEIWYGEFDQAGVQVIYNLDAYGMARSSIYDHTGKLLWFEENKWLHRASRGLTEFRLTRREM